MTKTFGKTARVLSHVNYLVHRFIQDENMTPDASAPVEEQPETDLAELRQQFEEDLNSLMSDDPGIARPLPRRPRLVLVVDQYETAA